MSFKLSRRSLDRLEGVDEDLQAVVKMAITLSKVDFGVIQGMRTLEQQKELVASGIVMYDDIADAMKQAALETGAKICWGAAWGTPQAKYPMDIRKWEGTMEEAMNAYIDLRRSQSRRPFMDGPHFEKIG